MQIEGMDVVKKMEREGSDSGKTKRDVRIANCGELSGAGGVKRAADEGAASAKDKAPAGGSAQRPKVFFDLAVGSQEAGRVVMELYSDVVRASACLW